MTASVLAGAAAGLGSVLISEAVLRYWKRRPRIAAMKVFLAGLALRAAWILAVLAAVLTAGGVQGKPFAVALLTSYLAAQVYEGFRYQRFIQSR